MKLIIALDFTDLASVKAFIGELNKSLDAATKEQVMLKVGMWLFYTAGPSIVEECKKAGFKVFVDLKLNDIPNTVAQATRALAGLEPEIISVHSAAGPSAMAAAVEAADGRMAVFAITVLTSMSASELRSLGYEHSLKFLVESRAKLAALAGCNGCVCSAHEAASIKALKMQVLCPGIRLSGSLIDDQVRVATPEFAKAHGADYIVMGRAILRATSPLEQIQLVLRSIND